MLVYVLYRKKEYVKYYNHLFSRATLFVIIFTIIPLFVSGITAYRTYGFYTTSVSLAIQPVVNLQPDMALSFISNSGVYMWNTQQSSTLNTVPTVSIMETDANYDGVKESLNINVKLYKPNINGIRFLLQFDYKASSSISSIQIQQPIVVSANSFVPRQKLVISGRLGFYQKRRLPNNGVLNTYNNMYMNASSSAAIRENPFDGVDTVLSNRNFTVVLKDVMSSWQVGTNADVFEVNVDIFYEPVQLQYHAEFWSMIKWGWVQWFYFLVIFGFCFQRFKELVFDSFCISARKCTTQINKCSSPAT